MADFNYGEKVEINKDGAWIAKGLVVKTTSIGAYIHGLAPAAGCEDDVRFYEWVPYGGKRLRMIRCN